MENLKALYNKMWNVQVALGGVQKTAENPYFKSNYIPLDKIVSELEPRLKSQNLAVFHQTKDGLVKTLVVDLETGESISSDFPLIQLNDPQKLGSCISYAKRYNLGQLFNIVTDKDDDAETAYTTSRNVAEKQFFGNKEIKGLAEAYNEGGKEYAKGYIEDLKEDYEIDKREKHIITEFGKIFKSNNIITEEDIKTVKDETQKKEAK